MLKQGANFAVCFIGLQISYLTWGFCQESLMTTVFTATPSVPSGLFPSAAFAVFCNRVLAVTIAAFVVKKKHGSLTSPNSAPLLSFAPCAMSNTFSSWAQYTALKYVTFPVQTLFKSSKIIPVMLMGMVLQKKTYGKRDYLDAGLITLGVFIFSYYSKSRKVGSDDSTDATGVCFLLIYIFCDAFTSNWQAKIYQKYGKDNVDSFQMMLGVNSFAIVFTLSGLLTSGDLPTVIEFLSANPAALANCLVTSITSATGQLFIFKTIKDFGPVPFTLIMTIRQILSIVISAVLFAHPINGKCMIGATMVFSIVGNGIYRKYKNMKKNLQ
ncbi:hypothetical protein TrVE_jg10849 [Triparma verrucosa]|nr:hypothetical protein TrVE_jg10849 [Triparma verrucosa]